MGFQHFVITRFSVRMRAGFGADAFPQEWLEHRLRLLRTYCLRGIAAQSASSFIWLLLCDESTDRDVLDRLLGNPFHIRRRSSREQGYACIYHIPYRWVLPLPWRMSAMGRKLTPR